MKENIILFLFVCLYEVYALNFPGPLVYVVTPSPKLSSANEGRSAPFYYHNWMRRMDAPENITTTTPKVKTPDLIFAEFESGSGDNMKKSIRKLLEKEKIEAKTTTTTTTTSRPIYVPDEEYNDKGVHEILPSVVKEENKQDANDMSDYYNLYNNLYNNVPAPVYLPSTTQSVARLTSVSPTTTPAPMGVENIWHIIDNEKHEQYSGNWNEVPINFEKDKDITAETNSQIHGKQINNLNENDGIDENFALPGFDTNSGNAAEDEYRAIRTEHNTRFPYVSLKPFQMKNPPLNMFSNGKKGTLTSLDNFHEVKNPVRGEVQDVQMRQPNLIDRYNPAQPYLPPRYGSTSKQSSPSISKPNQAVANLVPPPPPPASSQGNGDDFSIPNNYESFPPYPPLSSNSKPSFARPSLIPPVSEYQPPSSASDDSSPDSSPDNSNDGPPLDLGYRYKPPSHPAANFIPTIPPLSKPFDGYSYDKPIKTIETPPTMHTGGYSYNKPTKTFDIPPAMDTDAMDDYTYSKPQPPVSDDKPDFQGYHYPKPKPASPSYDHPPEYPGSHDYDGHHETAPHDHDSEYPELIFDKPHGDMHDTKQEDDTKDSGMMPPPPPQADMKPDMDAGPPPDDNGFPHDFPGDFKYHDFDDHDFHHHYHHHTTTTTTTTEMPRVNRYSYYYLGKKLYYLPLYFSVYFIVYVGALVIKAILRHKIVYPNSWRPNDQTSSFFSKRSIDSWDLSHDNLHEVTGRVTKAIGEAAEKYMSNEQKVK